ncbi:hypothetical protein AVEN_108552-1 [Araneus ventricosus]|uniref:Uncharacterized protein n=1 Tax=Araneus ventricosus TaxID=182803 RepID=A0A4Y2TS83_ARAVE|nr:hypothetical protein AVEN_108552-1 [Araneus ventricosus]
MPCQNPLCYSNKLHDGIILSPMEHSHLEGLFIGCPPGSNSGPLYWLLIVNDALEMDFGGSTENTGITKGRASIFVTGKKNKEIAKNSPSKTRMGRHYSQSRIHTRESKLIPFGKKS